MKTNYTLLALLTLPVFCAAATIAIWGIDEVVIYNLAYQFASTLGIPTHGTVSSTSLLFSPGMIWLALPFVAIFKNIVYLSIALIYVQALVLIVCLGMVLKVADPYYATKKTAYLISALYLVSDISFVLTAGNLWEQYVSRNLIILFLVLFYISIKSPKAIFFLLSGYLIFFIPGVHPIFSILIPFMLLAYLYLLIRKRIKFSHLTLFVLGSFICFLQIWIPWLIYSDGYRSVIETIRLGGCTSIIYCLKAPFLALQEWARLLIHPASGGIRQLPSHFIGHSININSNLTTFLSIIYGRLRFILSFTALAYCAYCMIWKRPTISGQKKYTSFIAMAYTSCFLAFLLMVFIGIKPFSDRPDYGGQFLGLFNFATAIGVFYIITNKYSLRFNMIARLFILIICVCMITLSLLLSLSIYHDVKYPSEQFIAEIVPASERMDIVKIISRDKDARSELSVKTYGYLFNYDSGFAQAKWLYRDDRFYTPYMLFDILFKRYGAKLDYVEMDESPSYVITIPAGLGLKERISENYKRVFSGSYFGLWEKQ